MGCFGGCLDGVDSRRHSDAVLEAVLGLAERQSSSRVLDLFVYERDCVRWSRSSMNCWSLLSNDSFCQIGGPSRRPACAPSYFAAKNLVQFRVFGSNPVAIPG